jgi:hypothetical protein
MDITTYPHLTTPPARRPLLPLPPVVIVVTPQVAARSYSRNSWIILVEAFAAFFFPFLSLG